MFSWSNLSYYWNYFKIAKYNAQIQEIEQQDEVVTSTTRQIQSLEEEANTTQLELTNLDQRLNEQKTQVNTLQADYDKDNYEHKEKETKLFTISISLSDNSFFNSSATNVNSLKGTGTDPFTDELSDDNYSIADSAL